MTDTDTRDVERTCETCHWWAGFAGKITDFGLYAPCTIEESPHFLKVTHIATTCDQWKRLGDRQRNKP